MAKKLDKGTPEQKICTELTKQDSDFRHIRNSLAHGRFGFNQDGTSVKFQDGPDPNTINWEQYRKLDQIRLDCLIVFDVMMSAYSITI